MESSSIFGPPGSSPLENNAPEVNLFAAVQFGAATSSTPPGSAIASPSTSSTAMPTVPVVVNVDVDGDLLLHVGADVVGQVEHHFRVCSSTLRRSSPVFKKMLFGPWKESKPKEGAWEVKLPEDSPAAMEVLLNMIHGNYEKIPSRDLGSLTPDLLHDVVIFTDKYDMTPAIRPWARDWTQPATNGFLLRALFRSIPNHECHPMTAHVAWGFGIEHMFTDTVKNIIFAASVTSEGDLVVVDKNGGSTMNLTTTDHYLGPLDSLVIIRRTRSLLIQTILDLFHDELKRLTGETPVCTHPEPRRAGKYSDRDSIITRKMCDNLILGSIWRKLLAISTQMKNLPTKASDYPDSANDLLELITKMFKEAEHFPNHSSCSPSTRLGLSLATIKNDERWTVEWLTDDHKRRLREQRTKLGLPDPISYRRADTGKPKAPGFCGTTGFSEPLFGSRPAVPSSDSTPSGRLFGTPPGGLFGGARPAVSSSDSTPSGGLFGTAFGDMASGGTTGAFGPASGGTTGIFGTASGGTTGVFGTASGGTPAATTPSSGGLFGSRPAVPSSDSG